MPTTSSKRYNLAHLEAADAILLGRTTYQIWAAFWPMPPDDPFGRPDQRRPQVRGLEDAHRADWSGTTILAETPRPRSRPSRRAPARSSFSAARTSSPASRAGARRRVPDPRLPGDPGSGKRLFRDEAALEHLRLVSTRPFASGVVLLVYEPQADAPVGKFTEAYAWSDAQARVAPRRAGHRARAGHGAVHRHRRLDRRAAALGDRPWRRLLDRHDQVTRAEVERWHGQLVKSTGDGVLATFDAPTRALRCAFGCGPASRPSGSTSGSPSTPARWSCGPATSAASASTSRRARSPRPPAGDIVATRTVRDLATGTDLVFRPLGSVSLRGVPGMWELFSASLGERDAAR